MKNKILFIAFSLVVILETSAQCAMCRAVLESEEGQATAKGINDGIVYLMAMPYILFLGFAYFLYRTFKKKGN